MRRDIRKMQYFATFAVSIASLTVGALSAWPTPVIPKLHGNQTDITITETEISWVIAVNQPGFLVGSLATGFISDSFGRRVTILSSALPLLGGTIFAALAVKTWFLYMARILWGVGVGMIGTVVNMYIAEIADPKIRGTLSQYTRVMFSFGTLSMMIVGPFVSFQLLNCLLLALPVCYFLICWWIPESPYYLFKVGDNEAARKVLVALKGLDEESFEEEFKLMELHVKNEMQRSSSFRELFCRRQYRNAIVIAAGLKLAQIMTGAGTIQQYLGRIVQDSGVGLKLSTVLIVFGAINFAVGLMTSILIDRIGRRPLLLSSFVGTGICLAIIGVYFFFLEVMEVQPTTLSMFGYTPFIGIIATNVISNLGYIPVVFLIPVEIFPTNVRAISMTSLSIYGGVLGFIISLGYQKLKDVSGLCGVFWTFAMVAAFGAVFVFFTVPETKGKSLKEIQEQLQGEDFGDIKLKEIPVILDNDVDEVKAKFMNAKEAQDPINNSLENIEVHKEVGS